MTLGELEWAAASRPATPGADLGDVCLVKPVEHGQLLAVVDGLGRGREAAAAAGKALRTIEHSRERSLPALFSECHRALQASRGAVMGLALVDTHVGSLTWVGVGDVTAKLCRAEPVGPSRLEVLFTHNGVVGRTLPPLRPVMRSLLEADVLVLTTDGIRGGFEPQGYGNDPAERLAAALLDRHGVPDDDALVLVARYRGEAP